MDRIKDVEQRRMKALGERTDSGIAADVLEAIVKTEGYKARMIPNSLSRVMNRVEIMLGGKECGGDR